MAQTSAHDSPHPKHPPGFRARRGLNWGFLGLLYTSFYMCRYNLSIANNAISQEFGFTRADMGVIITTALLAYAFGQIINGLLTDHIGGKRAMFIGAVGTIIMNILFGAAATWGFFAPAAHHGGLGFYEKRPAIDFAVEDIADVPGFAKKMRQDTNAISRYLKTQLRENTLALLAPLTKTTPIPAETRQAVADDLNRLIYGEIVYDTKRFAGIHLSRGATNLLAQLPPGQTSAEVNRVLLDEAYPNEIRRSHHWLVTIPFFQVQFFLGLLSLFVVIRGIDGYMQAFGSPGMIKINAAWFSRRERGRFAGIYGFMINLGRFGIFNLGPALLAGFVFLGLWKIPPLHWRWLFWAPSLICGLVALGMVLTVRETPEAAGFNNTQDPENAATGPEVRAGYGQILRTIVTNPTVWIVACAYACTGAVRQSVDQWFPRFMQENHHLDMADTQFQWLGFLIPFVASAGSLISGYISDTVFKGHRAPVAAVLYFLETGIILLAAQFGGVKAAIVFLILISFTANSTHSILGTAAAMDIGGRRMAGFASGVIDSFQYFGGSLAGYYLGKLLDESWGYYFYFMAPFGLMGGLLMLFLQYRIIRQAAGQSLNAPHAESFKKL
jgi:sugar phosphate permease